MAGPAALPDPHSWQFSAGHAFLRLAAAEAPETGPEPPGTIDRMAEAIQQLDLATAEGWRLLGVKLLREPRGFYQLNALLVRPWPTAAGPSAEPAVAEKAA